MPIPECVQRLRECAKGISALYFGAPVYLVGGAISDPDPRDLDVVVVVSDELFVCSYGEPGEADDITARIRAIERWGLSHVAVSPDKIWVRWARDCAKMNTELTKRCNRRVDFKVQPDLVQGQYMRERRKQLNDESYWGE